MPDKRLRDALRHLVILLVTIVLVVAIASSAQCQSRLRILYLNDFHGYAEYKNPMARPTREGPPILLHM